MAATNRTLFTGLLLGIACIGIYCLASGSHGRNHSVVVAAQRLQQAPANGSSSVHRQSAAASNVCNVYDISAPTHDTHECVTTSWKPAFHICIHPIYKDIFVSLAIKFRGIWEKNALRNFQELLEKDGDYGVIDIGANIGEYALLAASMGRPVVAVEARLLHVEMIHHAIQLDQLHDKFTLLHNAISDNHKRLTLQLTKSLNQGHTQVVEGGDGAGIPAAELHSVPAILMDDLLQVVHFKKAIIKIDIEGSEHRAISHCEKLLQRLYVPYMFMEWLFQKNMSKEQHLIITILSRNGYSAFSMDRKALHTSAVSNWPNDIIWKHKNATFD